MEQKVVWLYGSMVHLLDIVKTALHQVHLILVNIFMKEETR